MDALILSCGTGGGHNAAGKAVMEELQRRGHHTVMMNPYTLRGKRLAGRIDRAYVATAQKAPRVFGAVYSAGEVCRKLPFRSPVYYVNRAMISAMEKYLSQHHFDVVLMPHLFPAEILTYMKRRGMQVPKMIFIATDYCCIPFTEETECDAYIAPTADLVSDFIRRGIPAEKIHPFGIPTHSSFSNNMSSEEAKRSLGLPADKKYILITGGSMGAGKIEKAIEILQNHFAGVDEVKLMIVCGSNRTLYERLKERYSDEIIVVGHTDNMATYLKASDLYITKPGGLSSTEAAVSGVPILHISPIPGCETYNARYFGQQGMSFSCDVTDEAFLATLAKLTDEGVRASMTERQRAHINPNAAAQICDLAEKM